MRFSLPRSLTVRLTLLFSLSALSVLLLLGLVVMVSINRHFISQDHSDISRKLTQLTDAFYMVKDRPAFEQQLINLKQDTQHDDNIIVAILDHQKTLYFISHPVVDADAFIKNYQQNKENMFYWHDDFGEYRMMSKSLLTNYSQWRDGTIIVGLEISHHQTFLTAFLYSMWMSICIAAVLMGIFGWLAAKRGLLPLKKIIADTANVTASKLNQRLSTDAVPLELTALTDTLNAMLSRLEASFKRLSDFSSDLAHELRTPISNLKTQTQVILSKSRGLDEYKDALYSNAEELDHLSRMISDILFLAKSDNGLLVPNIEYIDLKKEVEHLFEFYEALAEFNQVSLHVEGQGNIIGDRTMLRRALSNLLSNAVVHSKAKKPIWVSIKKVGDLVQIMVENQGKIIPENQFARLFDRFYRMDSSRQKNSEGVGLGLAITRSIILAHKGTINVTSQNGVTCFTLLLPTKTDN